MEVAPCLKGAGPRAASLLTSLNLQREQAQFCDCVVRQRQNPGQLYPAHRCVLAASSPVLASILSSTGALVELQVPCLSDSVLELVLDYIYTGALPSTHNQQHYYNLLTAACHLQMDELREALRAEVNIADNINTSTAAENQPYKDITNTYSKTVNTFSKYLPLSDTCSVNSLENEDQYCDELETGRNSSKNGANHYSRQDANPLSLISTVCSVAESTGSSVHTGNCKQVTHLTPQGLIQNIPSTTEVYRVSRGDKGVQEDQFHLAGTIKPDSWQICTEEEQERTIENRRSLNLLCAAEVQEKETGGAEKTQRLCFTIKSKAEEKQTNRKEEERIHQSLLLHPSTSCFKDYVSPSQCSPFSPPPPHPCCGAVPVIRHSSTAVMVELSTVPPYHPVSQASFGSSSADYRSGSTDNDGIVESITTKHRNLYEAQNQDDRNYKDPIGAPGWDNKVSANQCAIQDLRHKSNADQSDIPIQDYNSSNTDHDEHVGNGLSHIIADNNNNAHCFSFQSENHTNHLKDDSGPQNEDSSSFIRGLKNETDLSFHDFPFKHQLPHCSDCHNVSMATAAEKQLVNLQDPRSVVPLPVQDSDTGSDSYCEDLCSEGEAKEEHSYLSRCPVTIDRNDSHCDLFGPKNDWYPNSHRAETKTKDAASRQHEHNNKDAAMDNSTGCTFQEHANISATKISEPHLTFPMPMDNNMSDSMYSVSGQSYHGHLHYHCLPQEDTHLSSRDSNQKHSHLSHPDHSDQSSDEEEVGTFASQHFATTDQVLLLDISAKPAELLVPYRHGSEKDSFGNGLRDNDREQGNKASSSGVYKRKIRARTNFGAESKPWVGETNVEDRKSGGKEISRSGDEAIQSAELVEDENQIATVTACSFPDGPDSVQAHVPSSLPVCIPSTLSVSMPTNTSTHLSTPVHHPFQCSLCDRSFSQRGSLNRHVRSHLGVRPFPCPRCPMTFSRQYRVTEHMRVHQRLGSDFQKPPASSV